MLELRKVSIDGREYQQLVGMIDNLEELRVAAKAEGAEIFEQVGTGTPYFVVCLAAQATSTLTVSVQIGSYYHKIERMQ